MQPVVAGFCSSQGAYLPMKDFSAFLDVRRCKNWAHKNQLLKRPNALKTCPASPHPPPSIDCFFSALHPELLSGDIEGQQLQ